MKRVAKAIILNSKGEILILIRGLSHPNFPGHFDFPGGEVEENELPNNAVAREVIEETGIITTPAEYQLLFSKTHDTTQHLLFIVQIKGSTPRVKLSWEHTNYIWMRQPRLLSYEIFDNMDNYYIDVIQFLSDKTL